MAIKHEAGDRGAYVESKSGSLKSSSAGFRGFLEEVVRRRFGSTSQSKAFQVG
jgi:hypothetical protein